MKSLIISSILLLVLISCGDDSNPTNAKDSYHELIGSIKGRLIDSITEEPIAGAFIRTYPLSSTTKSNEDGTFLLETVGPELYDIIITHEDYLEFKDKIRVSADITNNILFTMISKASINNAPNIPEIIYPKSNTNVGSNKFIFRWSGDDIDKDSLKYDVYFGKANEEIKLIASDVVQTYFEFNYSFVEGAEYQWKLIAKDKYSQTSSEIVDFGFKEKVVVDLPGIIANWKLDGEAIDSGIYGYDGSEQNVVYVADRNNEKNGAAFFNGANGNNSKIIVSKDIQLRTEFTIALWVKPDPSLGENGTVGYFEIVSKWGGAGNGKASWAFGYNKNLEVFLGTYSSSSTIKLSTIIIKPSQWQHLAVTFNNSTATFYLNGESIFVATGMQVPQLSNLNVAIGARPDQLSSYHGAIDDLYLFDRVLSEQEIQQLSN